MARFLGKAVTALTALSLAATPAIAAQGPASSLSLRASTAAENESDITSPPIVAIVALVGIIAGGVIIATQDNDDNPDSP